MQNLGAGDQKIFFIDTTEKDNIKYFLEHGEKNNFLIVINGSGKYSFDFFQKEKNSCLRVVILSFCDKKDISFDCGSSLEGENTQAYVEVVNFVNNGKIKSDTSIKVAHSAKGSIASLNQYNIFLGGESSIFGLPRLNILTNETRATHSLKAEKIKEEDIFYLKSRGLEEKKAINMILVSKIYKQLNFIDLKSKSIENMLTGFLEQF